MAEKTEIKVEGPDSKTNEKTPDQNGSQEPAGGHEGAPQGAESTEGHEGSSNLFEGIPEDHPVRAEVEKLRREAADKRTTSKAVREENEQLKQKLAEAKTEDDFKSAIADWESRVQEKEVEVLRERIARRHNVSDDYVEFLTGKDEETLEAQAKKLKSVRAPKPAGDPVGGRTPKSEQPSASDAAERIRKQRGRRRRP